MIEKEFRIFTDDSKENYYYITNKKTNISEVGKLISCNVTSNIPNAAINVPINSLTASIKFISSTVNDYDTLILNLPINKEMWEFKNNVPVACWYITSIEKIGVNTYSFDCVDEISILDNVQMYGRLFQGEFLLEALNSLTNYQYTCTVPEALKLNQVFGYYAPSSIKEALEQLSLNFGIFIYADVDEYYNKYIHAQTESSLQSTVPVLEPSNIFSIPSVERVENPEAFVITGHDFKVDATIEYNKIYESIVTPHNININNKNYYGEIIYFDKPYDNIRLTNGTALSFNKEGYLVFTADDFTQKTIVEARAYRDDTIVTTIGDITNENTKEINDITSISHQLTQTVMNNIINYYEAQPNISFSCHHTENFLKNGCKVWVPTEHNKYSLNKIVELSTDYTDGEEAVSQVTTISDFDLTNPERAKILQSIEIEELPTKRTYFINEPIDLTGIKVKAYYDDDSTDYIPIEDLFVTPEYTTELGEQEITVGYIKDTIVVTDTYKINVIKQPLKLIIDSYPDTVLYIAGESVIYTGLTAHVSYSPAEIKQLTLDDLIVEPFTIPYGQANSYNLPVKYYDEDSGITLETVMQVYSVAIGNLVSFNVTNQPNKTEYYIGERFDPTGMLVTAIFDSGIQRVIQNYTYDTTPFSSINQTSVTCTYNFDGTSHTWNVPVTVYNVTYNLSGSCYRELLPSLLNVAVTKTSLNGTTRTTIKPLSVEIIKDAGGVVTAWEYTYTNLLGELSKIRTQETLSANLYTKTEAVYNSDIIYYNSESENSLTIDTTDNTLKFSNNSLTVHLGNTYTIEYKLIESIKVNVNINDDYPAGQYYIYYKDNKYLQYILVYCPQEANNTYNENEPVEMYCRFITFNPSKTIYTYDELDVSKYFINADGVNFFQEFSNRYYPRGFESNLFYPANLTFKLDSVTYVTSFLRPQSFLANNSNKNKKILSYSKPKHYTCRAFVKYSNNYTGKQYTLFLNCFLGFVEENLRGYFTQESRGVYYGKLIRGASGDGNKSFERLVDINGNLYGVADNGTNFKQARGNLYSINNTLEYGHLYNTNYDDDVLYSNPRNNVSSDDIIIKMLRKSILLRPVYSDLQNTVTVTNFNKVNKVDIPFRYYLSYGNRPQDGFSYKFINNNSFNVLNEDLNYDPSNFDQEYLDYHKVAYRDYTRFRKDNAYFSNYLRSVPVQRFPTFFKVALVPWSFHTFLFTDDKGIDHIGYNRTFFSIKKSYDSSSGSYYWRGYYDYENDSLALPFFLSTANYSVTDQEIDKINYTIKNRVIPLNLCYDTRLDWFQRYNNLSNPMLLPNYTDVLNPQYCTENEYTIPVINANSINYLTENNYPLWFVTDEYNNDNNQYFTFTQTKRIEVDTTALEALVANNRFSIGDDIGAVIRNNIIVTCYNDNNESCTTPFFGIKYDYNYLRDGDKSITFRIQVPTVNDDGEYRVITKEIRDFSINQYKPTVTYEKPTLYEDNINLDDELYINATYTYKNGEIFEMEVPVEKKSINNHILTGKIWDAITIPYFGSDEYQYTDHYPMQPVEIPLIYSTSNYRIDFHGQNKAYQYQDYDYSLVKMYQILSNGEEKEVEFTVSDFDTSISGTSSVTFTSTDGNYSQTVDIPVYPALSISIAQMPDKITFGYNEIFEANNIKLQANYTGGVTYTIEDYSIEAPNTSQLGTHTVNITWHGFSTSYEITVKGISDFHITTLPTQTKFIKGYEFNYDGLVCSITTEEGTNTTNDFTVIAPKYLNTAGTISIKVVFNGDNSLYDTYNITVLAPDHLVVKTEPDTTRFYKDSEFNYDGLEVQIYYDEDILIDTYNYTVTPPDMSTTGTKTVSLVYGADSSVTGSYNIIVYVDEGLTANNKVTSVYQGDNYVQNDLQVILNYSDGTYEEISDYTISELNTYESGVFPVTISYKNLTLTYNVTVIAIDDIEIIQEPIKKQYNIGETISLNGLIVQGDYHDETNKIINNYNVVYPDMSTGGNKIVQIEYLGIVKTITIFVKAIKSIENTKEPNQLVFEKNGVFNSTGIEVTLTYNDNTTQRIYDFTVQNPDLSTVGTKEVIVEYLGLTDSYEIVVKELTGLTIVQLPTKTIWVETETFNYDGLSVSAIYNDGTSVPTENYTVQEPDFNKIGFQTLNVASTINTNISTNFTIQVVPKTPVSIAVNLNTVQTVWHQYDIWNNDDMTITVTYNDGDTEISDQFSCGVPVMSEAGVQTLTVSSYELTTTLDVTIIGVDSIECDSNTYSNTYVQTQNWDSSAFRVIVTYEDESTAVKTPTSVSTPDLTTTGTKTVTMTYYNWSDTFSINVIADYPVSFTIDTTNATTLFRNVDTFSANGIILTVTTYLGNTFTTSGGYTTSSPDMTTSGNKTITVTYPSYYNDIINTYTIEVRTPVGLSLNRLTNNIYFLVNQQFTLATVQLFAVYQDLDRYELNSNEYTVTPPDITTSGTKGVVFSYYNLTNYYNIYVGEANGIVITQMPQTNFKLNSIFNYDGLEMVYTISQGTTTAPVENYTVSSPDMSTTGKKTVTITSGSLTTTYTISVADKAVDYYEIRGAKQYFVEGTRLNYIDLTCEVYLEFDDGTNVTANITPTPNRYYISSSYTGQMQYTFKYDGNVVATLPYYCVERPQSNYEIYSYEYSLGFGVGGMKYDTTGFTYFTHSFLTQKGDTAYCIPRKIQGNGIRYALIYSTCVRWYDNNHYVYGNNLLDYNTSGDVQQDGYLFEVYNATKNTWDYFFHNYYLYDDCRDFAVVQDEDNLPVPTALNGLFNKNYLINISPLNVEHHTSKNINIYSQNNIALSSFESTLIEIQEHRIFSHLVKNAYLQNGRIYALLDNNLQFERELKVKCTATGTRTENNITYNTFDLSYDEQDNFPLIRNFKLHNVRNSSPKYKVRVSSASSVKDQFGRYKTFDGGKISVYTYNDYYFYNNNIPFVDELCKAGMIEKTSDNTYTFYGSDGNTYELKTDETNSINPPLQYSVITAARDRLYNNVTLDTSNVQTSFNVGDTFNSNGLKIIFNDTNNVLPTLEGTNFTSVSVPDMTTAGTKTVNVEYDTWVGNIGQTHYNRSYTITVS